MAEKKLETSNFIGTVMLKDWLVVGDGASYLGVTGKISILKDTDVLGFEVHKSESNWAARIESEDGSRSINVLGCQVKAIVQDNAAGKYTAAQFYKLI